jgi:hypothetical protein
MAQCCARCASFDFIGHSHFPEESLGIRIFLDFWRPRRQLGRVDRLPVFCGAGVEGWRNNAGNAQQGSYGSIKSSLYHNNLRDVFRRSVVIEKHCQHAT